MLTAARFASRLVESRGDITSRTFSTIFKNVSFSFSFYFYCVFLQENFLFICVEKPIVKISYL